MPAEPRSVQNRRLLRARDLMDRAYADALDIEALADSVHLSRAHFIRSFKETFGETPHGTSPSVYREREQAAPRAAIRAGVPGCFAAKWDRPRSGSGT